MPKSTKILLILAIVFGIFFRFWNLTSLPYPPDGDEVAFGYYGWSLLHYGTDEYGKILPSSFQSIGDYKYPGLAYLNTIPAALFGLSDLTTRFWSAALGSVLILLVYLLSQALFENRKISIFAAWFTALSPWAIIESRLGYEPMTSLTVITGAIVCLIYIARIKSKKYKNCLTGLSFALFLLSTFIYAPSRLFVPAMLVLFAIFSFLKTSPFEKYKKLFIVFLISLSLIISVSLLSPQNRGRASEDIWSGISSIENNRLQELYIQAGISLIKIPPRVTWMFHNKYRIAIFDFLERYAEHFSFGFLFLRGEASLQRIPDMGVLLLADIFLLPLGLIELIKNKFRYSSWIIFAWLFIAPIPSAIATGEARINRATLMIVPFAIISALGTEYIIGVFKNSKRIVAFCLLVGVIAFSSIYSLNQIFIQKPFDKPWYKQTVNENLTKAILDLKDKYQAVVTPDDDYIFFLFYGKISPSDFLKTASILPESSGKWSRVDRLGNIYFKMPFDCPKSGKLKVLYVCGGGNIPQNSKIIETFYYPDGVPAYSLIEFFPLSQLQSSLPELPKNLHYMVEVEGKAQFVDGIIPDSFPSFW